MEKDLHCLLPASTLDNLVKVWLDEDCHSFDYGAFVVGTETKTAHLFSKSPGVLAGTPFFDAVFQYLGCRVEWILDEGSVLESDQRILVAKVTGPSNALLQGERVALNVIARTSGIATRAREFQKIASQHSWHGILAGTRKTTPGFRLPEKYALLVGGVDTHRMDLSSMVMVKDNHIWSCGSITSAILRAKKVAGFSIKVEVEVRDEKESLEAAEAGADVIMLDNFTPNESTRVSSIVKSRYPHILVEVSGGLHLANIHEYMSDSVDILSSGSLTQGVPHVDFSLKIQKL